VRHTACGRVSCGPGLAKGHYLRTGSNKENGEIHCAEGRYQRSDAISARGEAKRGGGPSPSKKKRGNTPPEGSVPVGSSAEARASQKKRGRMFQTSQENETGIYLTREGSEGVDYPFRRDAAPSHSPGGWAEVNRKQQTPGGREGGVEGRRAVDIRCGARVGWERSAGARIDSLLGEEDRLLGVLGEDTTNGSAITGRFASVESATCWRHPCRPQGGVHITKAKKKEEDKRERGSRGAELLGQEKMK